MDLGNSPSLTSHTNKHCFFVFFVCPAGALLAAEHVKGSVQLSVDEGKDTRLQVSELVTHFSIFCSLNELKRFTARALCNKKTIKENACQVKGR